MILSRVRVGESEVNRIVVHFEIARLKGEEWRIIAVQGTYNSTKSTLNQVFAHLD